MPTKRKYTKNKQKSLIAASDRSKAYKMKLEGATTQSIADELKVSIAQAYRLVAAGANEVLEYNQMDLKHLVLVQGERIEGILASLYPQATSTGKEQHDAIDRCVKLFERQARLFGLDARPDANVQQASPFVFNINFGGSVPGVQQVDIIATSPEL